jgi:hypothetical protein
MFYETLFLWTVVFVSLVLVSVIFLFVLPFLVRSSFCILFCT